MTLPTPISAKLGSIISAISIVGIGLALMIPLLSIALDRYGASGFTIGLHTAVQALAAILTAFMIPRLLTLFGPRHLLTISILILAATVLGFTVLTSSLAWLVLRFILGGCLTSLFIVSEYWISAIAEDRRRGFIMGVYATFLSLGFAIGPAILSLLGSEGNVPYYVGAALFLLGLLPILASSDRAPIHAHNSSGSGLLTIFRRSPAAVSAAFFFGAIESSGFSFLPLWGERIGLSPAMAALLLTCGGLGNVVCQIPIGLLADRLNRPMLMLVCAGIGAIGTLIAPALAGSVTLLFFGIFCWGGVVGGIYTVGLANLSKTFDGPDLAAANSAFILNYAAGMLIGPPVTGLLFQTIGANGFIYAISSMAGIYALIIGGHVLRRA